jgi:holliday junction DNA helicase RuvB
MKKTDDKKSDILKDNKEEELLYTSLRADSWEEFHGQETVKKSLRIAIQAAKKRKEALEHVMLYGPPGLGKTTLSHIIASEMEKNIRVTSGPALERSGDLASILTNLDNGDVLFIDEIHRLHKVVEETLYPAMEDFCLDIVIGKGPSARTVRLDLPQFTIIGATTRVGLVAGPLRDRFGVVHRMNFYNPDELDVIIKKAADKLKVSIDEAAVNEVAIRARGTPRIALKLLKRVRDFAQVHEINLIKPDTVVTALNMLEVDNRGLDSLDKKYILSIINQHDGGPVGIETISSTLAEDTGTLEEMTEPYLLQIGFIKKTPRGRYATEEAYKHFNISKKS